MTRADDDLTARARIRDAALWQFAKYGFERTTIRGVAKAAGVSPGLVRHHFGSKEELRDAVDAYVGEQIKLASDEVMKAGQQGSYASAVGTKAAIERFRPYLMHAVTEGSTSLTTFFDLIVESTQQAFEMADAGRTDPPFADVRTRAAVYSAMVVGAQLLRDQVSRVLGIDIDSAEGDRQFTLALLDIYSHPVTTPELAATVRDAFEATSHPESRTVDNG